MGRVPKVNIYQDKKSGNWGVSYSVQGIRYRRIVASKKHDAIVVAADILQKLKSQEYNFLEEAQPLSIKELMGLFLDSKKHFIAPSSFKKYRACLEAFTAFMIENFATITDIKFQKEIYIRKFLDSLFEKDLTAKTVNAHFTIVKQMFGHAVSQGYMKDNPVKTLKKFPVLVQSQDKCFSKEELQKILEAIDPHWKDAIEFLALTGLRKGEFIHLEYSNFDEAKETIRIQNKPGWFVKNKRPRTVPLTHKAMEIIKRQHKSREHNFIFKGKKGNKVGADEIYEALKETLSQIGVSGTIHDLRHTHISHLAMRGVDLNTIATIVGHKDKAMTEIYTHLDSDHLKKAINKLDDLT